MPDRQVQTSNRDKPFWPDTGFTKGDLIDYYSAVAEAMVPHLTARPITLRRWPDGVTGPTFFQKNAPKHRPDWIGTVHLGDVDYLRIDEPAALIWSANSGAIEIHPGLATEADLDRPSFAVLDLDPGEGTDVITCCRLALILKAHLDRLGLQAWPKTSGSKGLQLYIPLNGTARFEDSRAFVETLARVTESEHPDLVVSTVEKSKRRKKVLIDWAQNAPSRTTVAVYAVRARPTPTVSTPVTWDEVEVAEKPADLTFDTSAVLERLDRLGDLMASVLTVTQELPAPKELG